MLAIALILIGLTATGSLASKEDPISITLLEIRPTAQSFDMHASPTFQITAPAGYNFVVQLSLAKVFFSGDASYDAYIQASGVQQNFYSLTGYTVTGSATVQIPAQDWSNMRGSVVFYRLISLAPDGGCTTPNENWENAPSINRTGESWYGMPLNDQARIGETQVVIQGKLNGKAISSDFGPRIAGGGSRFHAGLDIPVSVGTPVYAISDGAVISSPQKSSDHILMIEHIGGQRVGYVHLDTWLVAVGQTVAKGELIGYSGDWVSNKNASPHLHIDSGYQYVGADQNAYGAIFYNPLHYLPYFDEHVIINGEGTYLRDSYTNYRQIDINPAAGSQDIVLVAFGATTEYDKDLNYVEVQVNNSLQPGQYFILNYDDVTKQDSNTGVVTLRSRRTFRVRPLKDDIYGDTDLQYAFYVKPAETNVNQMAKDYFFFAWDVSTIKTQEDAGPHTIKIALAEVSKEPVARTVTVGPSLMAIDSSASAVEMTLDLMVTYHDIPEIQNGIIKLKVEGLPEGWSASFSDANPSIAVGMSKTIRLTLIADPQNPISADAMRANNTRVVATFGRIEAFKDNYVICPAAAPALYTAASSSSQTSSTAGQFCPMATPQVSILAPLEGAKVPVGKTFEVKTFAAGAGIYADASVVVQNLSNGATRTLLNYNRNGDTFTFKWIPEERVNYGLIAQLAGFPDSQAVTVSAVNDEVIFLQPTDMQKLEGGKALTVIVDALSDATKVTLEITPAEPTSGGEMKKAADGTWQFASWVPSKAVDYYSLVATAQMPDGSRPYAIIRVEPMPDIPTISVPSSVQLGATVDVTVTAPGAFSVTLFAGGKVEPAGQEGVIWRFKWTPDAMGEFIVWANAAYAGHPDQQTEQVKVQVIDEGANAIVVKITSPAANASVNMGAKTLVQVESLGEMVKVELEITDPAGKKETITYTSSDLGGKFSKVGIPWTPSQTGNHSLKASGWNASGWKGWSDRILVTVISPQDPGMRIPINDFSFIWKNKEPIPANLQEGSYWNDWQPKFHNTHIPYSDYACGIVGIDARGGDIGEEVQDQIIQAYLPLSYSKGKGTWHVMLDFQTYNYEGLIFREGKDKPERWNIQLLCIHRDKVAYESPDPNRPIFFKSFTGLGDDVGGKTHYSTGIRTDEYTCGIVGFDSNRGDIQEKGTGNIILAYLYQQDNTWNIRADFRTHNGNLENWDVDVMCISNKWASLTTPAAGKPFVLKEYKKLGDDISYATEFEAKDWACGVVGFAARNGDINENEMDNNDANLILAYMSPSSSTGKWHIRADFRTHNTHENWDVNVLCVRKDLSAAPHDTSASPKLFTGYYDEARGKKYGPGMFLDWEDSFHPEAAYYQVQFSLNSGATWQDIYSEPRKLSDGSWINHHGDLSCGHSFHRCLKPNQIYHYRLRLMDGSKAPLMEWSDIFSGISYEWPANVELAQPSPVGPYWSDDIVMLWVRNTYGHDLHLSWEIIDYNGASHSIVAGCADGSYYQEDTTFCEIEIYQGQTNLSSTSSPVKMAALLPETSVEVRVTGRDSWGYTKTDYRILAFRKDPNGRPEPIQSFGDVPPNHWAYTYIETLADQGITSGCTTVGTPSFCPDGQLLRSHQAVFTVRSRHLDQPGYVPPSPKTVSFIDEEAQPVFSLASNSPDPAYRSEVYWYDKYIQELYDDGVIAGCRSDPLMFCPNDPTTRAQLTVFAVRLLYGEGFTPSETNHQIYNDVPLFDAHGIRIWSAKWISMAHQAGLIQACGTDMAKMLFRPEAAVTRAEAACMMYYALEAKEN